MEGLIFKVAYCITGTELLAVLIKTLIHFSFTEHQNLIINQVSIHLEGAHIQGGLLVACVQSPPPLVKNPRRGPLAHSPIFPEGKGGLYTGL